MWSPKLSVWLVSLANFFLLEFRIAWQFVLTTIRVMVVVFHSVSVIRRAGVRRVSTFAFVARNSPIYSNFWIHIGSLNVWAWGFLFQCRQWKVKIMRDNSAMRRALVQPFVNVSSTWPVQRAARYSCDLPSYARNFCCCTRSRISTFISSSSNH